MREWGARRSDRPTEGKQRFMETTDESEFASASPEPDQPICQMRPPGRHWPALTVTDPTPTPAPSNAPESGRAVMIPVNSEKQAMDWSLTLASQEILCLIRPPTEGARWSLEVDPRDAGRALRTLRQYHLENRRRQGVLTPRVGDFVFHWAVLLWCLAMVMVFSATTVPGGQMEAAGAFDTRLTGGGQWWRPITATFLHAGPEHLTANLAFGFLLLGLAMGRTGRRHCRRSRSRCSRASPETSLPGRGEAMITSAWDPRAWSWAPWDCWQPPS